MRLFLYNLWRIIKQPATIGVIAIAIAAVVLSYLLIKIVQDGNEFFDQEKQCNRTCYLHDYSYGGVFFENIHDEENICLCLIKPDYKE